MGRIQPTDRRLMITVNNLSAVLLLIPENETSRQYLLVPDVHYTFYLSGTSKPSSQHLSLSLEQAVPSLTHFYSISSTSRLLWRLCRWRQRAVVMWPMHRRKLYSSKWLCMCTTAPLLLLTVGFQGLWLQSVISFCLQNSSFCNKRISYPIFFFKTDFKWSLNFASFSNESSLSIVIVHRSLIGVDVYLHEHIHTHICYWWDIGIYKWCLVTSGLTDPAF